MVEFRQIIFSLLTMLMSSSAATTGKISLVGDEVTLHCQNVTHDEDKCDSTTWLLSDPTKSVLLFEHGKIHQGAGAKSDRLSLTENCSLVIKKVSADDAGSYTCRQFKSGENPPESQVHLTVVNMLVQEHTEIVMLNCLVSTYQRTCRHTVKLLYEGQEKDSQDMKASSHSCTATVTIPTSHFHYMSKHHKLIQCNVTDHDTKTEQLFPFSPQSSGEETGWWWVIVVSVSLAALITSVFTVNVWTRTKANKTQTGENVEQKDEDEDDGTVDNENHQVPSAPVTLERSSTSTHHRNESTALKYQHRFKIVDD